MKRKITFTCTFYPSRTSRRRANFSPTFLSLESVNASGVRSRQLLISWSKTAIKLVVQFRHLCFQYLQDVLSFSCFALAMTQYKKARSSLTKPAGSLLVICLFNAFSTTNKAVLMPYVIKKSENKSLKQSGFVRQFEVYPSLSTSVLEVWQRCVQFGSFWSLIYRNHAFCP